MPSLDLNQIVQTLCRLGMNNWIEISISRYGAS